MAYEYIYILSWPIGLCSAPVGGSGHVGKIYLFRTGKNTQLASNIMENGGNFCRVIYQGA